MDPSRLLRAMQPRQMTFTDTMSCKQRAFCLWSERDASAPFAVRNSGDAVKITPSRGELIYGALRRVGRHMADVLNTSTLEMRQSVNEVSRPITPTRGSRSRGRSMTLDAIPQRATASG